MSDARVVPVVLALVAIGAIAVGAGSLETAVESDPEDVIDLDASDLPVDAQTLSPLKDAVTADSPDVIRVSPEDLSGGDLDVPEDSDTRVVIEGDPSELPDDVEREGIPDSYEFAGGTDGPASEGPPGTEGGSGVPSALAPIGLLLGEGSGGGDGGAQATDGGSGADAEAVDSEGAAADTGSTGDDGVPLLTALAALGAIAVGLRLLAGRYGAGTGLGSRLRRLVPGSPASDDARGQHGPGHPTAADDEVAAAWLALLQRIDPGASRPRTTDEWERRAVADGYDPDAVAELRRTYEAVRYGDYPVTDERRDRARSLARRLDLRLPTGGGA